MPLVRQRYRRPFSLDAGFDETEEIENTLSDSIQMSSRSTPSSCRRRRSHFMQKKYDSTDSSNCSGILFSDIIYNKSSMNFGKKFASTELVLMLYVLSKGRLNITASTTYFLVYTYTYIHKDIFCTYVTNHA